MRIGLVVADTGPIISLAQINKLDLLFQLSKGVRIPTKVWDELLHSEKPETSLIKIKLSSFVTKTNLINYKSEIIDDDEIEAINLFFELKADYLLIDDRKARREAEKLDIKCLGTLGLLFLAKKRNLLPKLKPIFDELLNLERYYSVKLMYRILLESNEELIESKKNFFDI